MNVLFISECHKNALKETRRVLDQFAERCGTRTWRTCITEKGLETVKNLLKKTARKNTAVACHWLRSRKQTDLLWIIGNSLCFNEEGIVPTNRTKSNILKKESENDWHTATDIKLLAECAALFHDFGKANNAFQAKLKNGIKEAYRHEWVSLQLFVLFVGDAKDDQEWLSRLRVADISDSLKKIDDLEQPFKKISKLPLASAIAWLIVTHHFLPYKKGEEIKENFLETWTVNWNRSAEEFSVKEECLLFQEGTPFNSKTWCLRAHTLAENMLARESIITTKWMTDPYSLHMARLSLMLADHYYSSLNKSHERKKGDDNYLLYANTDRKTGDFKQKLDEHLIGVASSSKKITRQLPNLVRQLPRIARHKGFKKLSKGAFSWQNKAYDLADSLREKTETQGFFGVNMASTGCGKTLANGKIMYALSDPKLGARFAIALGLRVLTLQTGEAYRNYLGLKQDELAIVVGSNAVKTLFEAQQKDTGSESEKVFFDDAHVLYEGNYSDFSKWLQNDEQTKKILDAPILISTIDQLIDATEGTRGGRQIIPMLRLLTSDLVLDEPDDFDVSDLYALTRLVHWAGLLGSRVLLSSATLPPAIVEGLFLAYRSGREKFQKVRGIPHSAISICCAWFDEYRSRSADCNQVDEFKIAHERFVEKRIQEINQATACRKAVIKPFNIDPTDKEFYKKIAIQLNDYSYELHNKHYTIDLKNKKKVSFGLIRFANINQLAQVAEQWFTMNTHTNSRIFLCCYHSRHPLIVRSNIEYTLDTFLKRTGKSSVFNLREYQILTHELKEENFLFIVLATPVAEVGRDHDYDWAIVEPSSMRSIIQLAGRVQRHRQSEVESENIYLLDTNIKSLKNPSGAVIYTQPGFEKDDVDFRLKSKKLSEILNIDQYEKINSIPRIIASKNLKPKENLVDLEHYCLFWSSKNGHFVKEKLVFKLQRTQIS